MSSVICWTATPSPYQFLPHDSEAGRQLLAEAGHLEHLTLGDTRTGRTQTVPGTALLILIGAQPHTD